MSERFSCLADLTDLTPPSVIMMAGVPASGKSTIARELGTMLDLDVLSSDAIREEITGSESDLSRDRDVWSSLYERVERVITQRQSCIVDATHNSLHVRERDIERYREYGARMVVCVHVIAELETVLTRNRARERFVPEAVISRMHTNLRLDPPSHEDGFDAVIRLSNG